MATMVKLSRQVGSFVEEVYAQKNETEAHRLKEYKGAVKIQSWYRALRARAYLRYLVGSANLIQKRYRGFQGRKEFRVYLKNEVFVMKLNHYNSNAVKIQKVWRGFFVRKYIFNYYSFKRYLHSLQVKNEAIRESLKAYKEQQLMDKERQWIKAERDAKEAWLRKHHHLVSTAAVPGIFNSPYLPCEEPIELELRAAKPLDHKKKRAGKSYNPTASRYDIPVPRPPSLPSLHSKPQGPFREPEDVRKQRYKPFKPSLRVETDFLSLERAREQMKADEWVARVHDEPFQPFTHSSKPYEPLHHTSSQYGHIPFGHAYFREEFPDRFVVPENMRTVVPPIPIFDKLNDTYSQGEV